MEPFLKPIAGGLKRVREADLQPRTPMQDWPPSSLTHFLDFSFLIPAPGLHLHPSLALANQLDCLLDDLVATE